MRTLDCVLALIFCRTTSLLATLLFALKAFTQTIPAGAVIESIEIVVEDVFEENGEVPDFWAYRLANQLHIKTREKIVLQELLFSEGEEIDEEALAQTERNLRALPFVRRARIEKTLTQEGNVHIRVTLLDSWSTQPEFRFAKTGNDVYWAVGLTEKNFLGYGKELKILRSSDLDRQQTFAQYNDPRFFGSRVQTNTLVSDASDGHRIHFQALRPFYAIDTMWSFRAQYEDFERLDPIYAMGERVDELHHLRQRKEVAVKRTPATAVRVHIGYDGMRETFDETIDSRRFGMIRTGISSVSHRFLKLNYLNRFERPDDINLGNETAGFIGVSTPETGGEDSTSWHFLFTENIGFRLNNKGFVLTRASWEARHRNEQVENSLFSLRVNLVQKLTNKSVFLAKAELVHGHQLDAERQVRLGADNGLRGYPVRQFNGDRSFLVSAEARWFLFDDVANLASIGVATFVDTGYAWPKGQPMVLSDMQSDVGMSLLIGGSRVSASRPGVRIDLAYAFSPIEGHRRWLFSLGSQMGF